MPIGIVKFMGSTLLHLTLSSSFFPFLSLKAFPTILFIILFVLHKLGVELFNSQPSIHDLLFVCVRIILDVFFFFVIQLEVTKFGIHNMLNRG